MYATGLLVSSVYQCTYVQKEEIGMLCLVCFGCVYSFKENLDHVSVFCCPLRDIFCSTFHCS